MNPMFTRGLLRASLVAAILAVALAVLTRALDLGPWAWFSAGVAAVLIATLTARDEFYGHRL
jgi:hypothetical protein